MNGITSILGIHYPIIQGGMGNISNAILTAAVSEAGGLGTIGAGTMTADEVEKIIIETKKLTEKPFSLNVALSVSPNPMAILKLAVKHRLAVVTLSAGNPAPFIGKLHDEGIVVITVVASVKQAEKAEKAGADILVAEGFEAAGINSALETTTLALIPQILNRVNIPLVAAGGIGDGKGLAAMLCLGASGVQMGTRFIATKEAPFHDSYKQKLLDANDHGTVIVGRSVGKIRRLLDTSYAHCLLQREAEGITPEVFADLTTEEIHKKGALEGKEDEGFMNGGQVSGLITDIPSVAELLDRMMEEARAALSAAGNKIG
ncbi:NAD(P)H-dependent flavin oxidoreductase [Bacillus massilinigeriensis]|uniref:NAD(P)H-dependent flavin oxidoreductase n=1 Tax=Bacillus mediterraneensis TaxID=1805474 RepID=UPI0008F91451|nr:nitronate monooxygenase [Bacillus mediterraneensis]